MIILYITISLILALIVNWVASRSVDWKLKEYWEFYTDNEYMSLYFLFINIVIFITFILVVSATFNTFIL